MSSYEISDHKSLSQGLISVRLVGQEGGGIDPSPSTVQIERFFYLPVWRKVWDVFVCCYVMTHLFEVALDDCVVHCLHCQNILDVY